MEKKFDVVKSFGIDVLKLPQQLLDQENVIKLMTLLFPCTIR